MSPRLNPLIDVAEYERHHTKERAYMDGLRERDLLLEIDNVMVDGEQLVLRTFQCNTNYCVRCTGVGATKEYKGSCCTDLQVDVTHGEKNKLLELAHLARQKLEFKATDPVLENVEKILEGKITEMNDENELVLRHKKTGACVMSYIDQTGQLRCSINTLVSRLGLSIEVYKPDPCYLFPLHYAQVGPDLFLLSMLTEETRDWIDQDVCVGKLKCLRKPEKGSPPAYVFLRGELEYLWGKKFYRTLERLAGPILERYLEKGSADGAGGNHPKPASAAAPR